MLVISNKIITKNDIFISTRHKELYMLINEKKDHAHLIQHRIIKPLKRVWSKK